MKFKFDNEAFDKTALEWYKKGLEQLSLGNVDGATTYCDWLYGAYRALNMLGESGHTEWYVHHLEEELSEYINSYGKTYPPIDYAGCMHQSPESDYTEGF